MLIARQILLRPNTRQRRAMGQHAGYTRWTYNTLRQRLSDAIDATPAGQFWPTIPALAKELRRERPGWAMALSQNVFDNARRNLEMAMRRWNDCRKGRHHWHAQGSCGFPKMHKRSANRNGFTASDGHPERNRIDKRKVHLPRIGWVRMAEDTPTDAPRQIHIKQIADRWFAVIVFDNGSELPEPTPADRASAAALMANLFAGEAAIRWGEQIAEGNAKHRAMALASQAASYARLCHDTMQRARACAPRKQRNSNGRVLRNRASRLPPGTYARAGTVPVAAEAGVPALPVLLASDTHQQGDDASACRTDRQATRDLPHHPEIRRPLGSDTGAGGQCNPRA